MGWDDNFGVFKTMYSLDDGNIWSVYTNPFTLSEEREKTILYKSTDKAGNIKIQKEYVLKIDKTAPEAKMYFDKDNLTLKIGEIDNLTENPTVFVTKQESSENAESDKHYYKKYNQESKEEKYDKKEGNDKHKKNDDDCKKKDEHDSHLFTIHTIENEVENITALIFKKLKQKRIK